MPQANKRKKRAPVQRDNMPLLIGGGVAALIVVVLLLILNANLDKQTAAVVVSAGKIWGKADAPVTVEIFSDFQ